MMQTEKPAYSPFEYFELKTVLAIGPTMQIIILCMLFTLTVLGHYFEVRAFGTMAGYAPGVSILFVPIYEELIFRGVLLRVFQDRYGIAKAIIFSSVIFGIWHIKNIFWLNPTLLIEQIGYTALIFGPIMAWITFRCRTVWPAVALHYLNNFNSPLKGWMTLIN